LNSMFKDPGQILDQYNDPPQGNLADVYRLRLGMPYVAAEDKLKLTDVYSCCNNDAMATGSQGPCAMGVDVGKIKHVVIGVCTGRDKFQILKMARLSAWEDIHDIAKRFGVTSCVIDIRPYEDEARRFQVAENYRIYLCEYSENPMQDATWNNKDKTVRAYRTGVFDRTHKMFTQDEVELPRRCPEMEVFARQVCSAAKVLVINQRTGTSVYRYQTVGNDGDHYRNAMNYFSLAASGHRLPRVNATTNQAKYALNEVVRI